MQQAQDSRGTGATAPTATPLPKNLRRQHDVIQTLLDAADVRLDGGRPWDPRVLSTRFYRRVLHSGSLGLGTAYMNGEWECEALEEFFYRVLRAGVHERAAQSAGVFVAHLRARLFNPQRRSRAFDVAVRHYDLGNDLFERMLDRRMIYSCGYWARANTLDEAQEAKLDLICQKLGLQAGMRLLDVGCGWGGLMKFASEQYGVHCVGVTVSREQAAYAQRLVAGLPVEVRLQDYREIEEPFDRVVSVGMFEHVGPRNYRTFMQMVHRCLPNEGLLLLHTIGSNRSRSTVDPWIDRYIFPDGVLPSARQITSAAEGLFVLEDWHSFGADYHRTLMAWHENFVQRWGEIANRYGERFYRTWRYYLQSTAGSFRARRTQLWQVVFSKDGVNGGYRSLR